MWIKKSGYSSKANDCFQIILLQKCHNIEIICNIFALLFRFDFDVDVVADAAAAVVKADVVVVVDADTDDEPEPVCINGVPNKSVN